MVPGENVRGGVKSSKRGGGKLSATARRNLLSDERAITPIAGFAIVLMLIASMYTYYQVFGVPEYCKGYEVRQFVETVREITALSGSLERVALEGTGSASTIELGGSYPEIPFFTTPKEYSGMLASYPAEIKILNAVATDPELQDVWSGAEVDWIGTSLLYSPSTAYYTPGDVRLEYGVVAIGKSDYSLAGGVKIVDGRTIFLGMFSGNYSDTGAEAELHLYSYSGGGNGIGITDNGNPITIYLKTDLPLDFWQRYFEGQSYVSLVSESGGYVVVTLVRGITYRLVSGIAGFEDARASQHYLYRLTSKAITTPATLAVEVRDSFNNPVPGINVTFTSQNSSTTLTDGKTTGTSLTVTSTKLGIASVVAKSSTGPDVVVASITRPDGTTYQIAFVVV